MAFLQIIILSTLSRIKLEYLGLILFTWGGVEMTGRPRKYSDEQIKRIKEMLNSYITMTEIPLISEFCYQNDIMRQSLYDYEEFSTLIKKAKDKRVAKLFHGGLHGKYNPTVAIFGLKNDGWSDKQDIDLVSQNHNTTNIDFSNKSAEELKQIIEAIDKKRDEL